MVFLTLEDETGVVNVVVWKRIYGMFRKAVIAGRLVRVRGRIQREGAVTHLIAEEIEDVSPLLATLGGGGMPRPGDERNDGTKRPDAGHARPARHPREQARRLFPSRDFH